MAYAIKLTSRSLPELKTLSTLQKASKNANAFTHSSFEVVYEKLVISSSKCLQSSELSLSNQSKRLNEKKDFIADITLNSSCKCVPYQKCLA